MANKRRPKKTRGLHYKKYIYGQEPEEDEAIINEELIRQQQLVELRRDEAAKRTEFKEVWFGERWPRSNFQKVDVLKVSIALKQGWVVKPIDEYDNKEKMKLPFELILLILEHSETPNCLNHLLICKAIYGILLPRVYRSPRLTSINFCDFVEVVSTTQSKKKFKNFVKILDLSQIIQSGKNSFVSKLLRRFSHSLEVFVASQASFGISQLISLRLCHQLKVLDLRLVSETVNLKELFSAIKASPMLEQLSFPRSSITCEDYEMEWPENLWYLRLQGGISNKFLTDSTFPQTITTLEFAHCPNINGESINDLLIRIGYHLKKLSIFYPMPNLKGNSMDPIFLYCPMLTYLYINIEYVSKDMFDDDLLPPLLEFDRPLKTLVIDSSRLLGQGTKVHPDDLTIAIYEDRLPCLKTLKVSLLLGWDFKSDPVQDLVNEFGERGGSIYTLM